MGTFHNDKGELHGITVVVDTKGPRVLVGRCDEMDDERLILLDVDIHEEGQNGRSKAQYVERAAKFGVWKKHDRVVVPCAEVASVRRLGEVLQPSGVAVVAVAKTPEAVATAPAAQKGKVALATGGVEASAGAQGQIVALTLAAQEEVKRLLAADHKPGTGLRLGVKGGGCSGLSYRLEFDSKKEGDLVVPYAGFNVFLDRKSTIYLRGISLDHQKGLSGKGFVFHNPNASNTCGCGESFSI